MARLHSRKKGKSHSNRPPVVRSTQWINMSPDEIESTVVKLYKEGMPVSLIGIKMRDIYGIPSVKYLTNKSVKKILEENGLKDEMPEDINNLIIKAQKLVQHIKVNKADRRNVHALELIEAKVYRLSKYYKKVGVLPNNWKYRTVIAQLT